MKRKILLAVLLLIGFYSYGQPGYTTINSRYAWKAGRFTDGLHVPSANGVPSDVTGVWVGDGAVAVDTANGYFYFRVGGVWKKTALFSDITTPTWQQTLTAGSTLTGNNTIDVNSNSISFTGFTGFILSGDVFTYESPAGADYIRASGQDFYAGDIDANTFVHQNENLFEIYHQGSEYVMFDLANNFFYLKQLTRGKFFDATASGVYKLGDVEGLSDGTLLTVDDDAEIITLDADNGIIVSTLSGVTDTTNFKPVVVNTTGASGTIDMLYQSTYWPGGGGSQTLQQVITTGATLTGDNSITNGANTLTITNNSLAGDNGVSITSNSTAAASNAQKLFNVALSGANGTSTQTTWAGYFSNSHTGTSSTNVGVRSDAGGGDANYGFYGSISGAGSAVLGYGNASGAIGVEGLATNADANAAYFHHDASSGSPISLYSKVIGANTTNTAGKFEATGATTNNALDLKGNIKWNGTSSGAVTITPAAAAGTYTLTLPADDGDAGEVLTTDGSGVLSWELAEGSSTIYPSDPLFRLTLSPGTAVPTTDITAQDSIFYTPYKGNTITLYNGSAWVVVQSAEVSLPLGTLTSGKNYDVFAYSNAGTLTLEFSAAWSDDNTRTDALTTQDGVLVKSGATTRRYIGTFRTTSTTTTEDSKGGASSAVGGKRFVWNYYNRVRRTAEVFEGTDNWGYVTNTWRQANGAAGNQVEYVTGDASLLVNATVTGAVYQTATAASMLGIGVSSTSSPSGIRAGNYYGASKASLTATYNGTPGLGYFYIAWLEKGGGGSGTIWDGDGAGDGTRAGLTMVIEN